MNELDELRKENATLRRLLSDALAIINKYKDVVTSHAGEQAAASGTLIKRPPAKRRAATKKKRAVKSKV